MNRSSIIGVSSCPRLAACSASAFVSAFSSVATACALRILNSKGGTSVWWSSPPMIGIRTLPSRRKKKSATAPTTSTTGTMRSAGVVFFLRRALRCARFAVAEGWGDRSSVKASERLAAGRGPQQPRTAAAGGVA